VEFFRFALEKFERVEKVKDRLLALRISCTTHESNQHVLE